MDTAAICEAKAQAHKMETLEECECVEKANTAHAEGIEQCVA